VHLYLRPDEYHQSFNFDLLETPWVAADYRAAIQRSLDSTASVGSIPSSVLANHDVMREATRLGLPPGTNWRKWLLDGPHDLLDADAGLRRARAAGLIQLSLPGSTYLYQGQELGLPEVWDLPPEVLDDPVWERSGRTAKGRDGCRVPIPWTVDGPSFGFGAGKPWLPQPADWGGRSAEAQNGVAGSTHTLFRDALALRKQWCVDDEELVVLDLGPDLVAFRRGSGLVCVANMGSEAAPLPDHDEVLVRSGLDGDGSPLDAAVPLAPDEAAWLR
jgi:alpha-glucosidase